jgi:glycerol-3-phosphate dehydrogenase
MGEDVVNEAARVGDLPVRPSRTAELRVHEDKPLEGSEVIHGVRKEMARTVEDVLARRTRALFLNAHAAMEAAPRVAQAMAKELGRDEAWERGQVSAFTELARGYCWDGIG